MSAGIVVIGAGPGGYLAALKAASLGARVAVVERGGVGGTCLHWGCIPTKTLKASADALALARRGAEFGLAGGGAVTLDLAAAQRRKDEVVALQTRGIEALFQARGVELLRGEAALEGPGRVRVRLAEGGERDLSADRVILAAGAAAFFPPGLEPEGRVMLSSDDALGLSEVPDSLAVVGGGVVGCEFAAIFAALGSQVTIVEALDRLLPVPNLEPAISKLLLREMKKRRVKVHLAKAVTSCRVSEMGAELTIGPSPFLPGADPDAHPIRLTAAKVLVAVGRRPAADGLAAGLEVGPGGGLAVDETLATSLPGVYAVGDLLGPSRPMLAHLAGHEGKAAAVNALGGAARVDYGVVAAVAFTSPEVAWVGETAAQAAGRGLAAYTADFPLRVLGKAQASGEIAGQVTLVCQEGDGRLLGAHILGAHAAEMVHECALAIKLGATAEDVADTIHAHPTYSEGLAEAAEAAAGGSLHLLPT